MNKKVLSGVIIGVVVLVLIATAVTIGVVVASKITCKHDNQYEIEVLPYKAATCQEEGLTEGKKCNYCGKTFVEQEIIPTTSCDSKVILQKKDPTCTQTGLTQGGKCSMCGKITNSQQTIDKIPCNESSWIVDLEPTITTDGSKHTECTMCGKIIQQEIIGGGTQGLEYELNRDGTYTLDGDGNRSYEKIVIPSIYNGQKVTSIATHAFMKNGSRKIIIPNTVTTIQAYAFSGCSQLENVVLSEGLQSIDYYCFKDCKSLKSIDIPDSVTSIGHSVFWGCANLKTITIPKSVTKLPMGMFYKCSSLTTIKYEGTIEEWNNVEKHYDLSFSWNASTGEYTIYCTDGQIAKDGTVTYN